MTVINGTRTDAALSVKRYAEVIGQTKQARDVLTGSSVALDKDLKLTPRQALVLEF